MKKYIVRAVKYFIALCVIYVALMWLMIATKTTLLTPQTMVDNMLYTPRGWLMIGAIVLLAGFYPRFGFAVRKIEGDITDNREQIMNAFRNAGFRLVKEEDEVLTFHATAPLRRLSMLFEDKIVVSQYGQWIVLEGNRRGVAQVDYRLVSYIENTRRDENN